MGTNHYNKPLKQFFEIKSLIPCLSSVEMIDKKKGSAAIVTYHSKKSMLMTSLTQSRHSTWLLFSRILSRGKGTGQLYLLVFGTTWLLQI